MSLILKKVNDTIFRLRYGAIELSNSRYEKLVKTIVAHEPEFSECTDGQLQAFSKEVLARIANSKSRNSKLFIRNTCEFFAIAREAAKRTVAMQPYTVQLLASLALAEGKMVEMQTGEGKTLAAVAAACLHAISGKGSHVLTFNDYLAGRDAEWMKPLYEFLGFSVGHVSQGMPIAERKHKPTSATSLTLLRKKSGSIIFGTSFVFLRTTKSSAVFILLSLMKPIRSWSTKLVCRW